MKGTRELAREAGVGIDGTGDQHFLVDDRVLDRMVEKAPEREHVLEIGGGVGSITQRLVEKYDEVTVVEIDGRLAEFLRYEFDVNVIEKDATEAELPEFDTCVSNLPFSSSSPILFRLLPHAKPMILKVQREFAERVIAGVGDKEYGRLSVAVSRYADADILETVPPEASTPPPEVESALVRFEPREDVPVAETDGEADDFFADLLRGVFTQRRKTLRNALRNTTNITGIDEQTVYELPESLLSERPGDISPEQYIEIAEVIDKEER